MLRYIFLPLLVALLTPLLFGPQGLSAEGADLATQEIASQLGVMVEEYAAEHLPRGGVVLGVARSGKTEWYSTRGLDPDTPIEIGSITKGITGMWLAAAIQAGSLTPDTTVGALWPSESEAERLDVPKPSTALAEVTLQQLATHTSGLPRLNMGIGALIRAILHGDNPYRGLDGLAVYRDAVTADLAAPGTFRYSNLGYALLGQLLLRNAGYEEPSSSDYVGEVNAAVLSHLGLRGSYTGGVAASATPFAANGRRTSHWDFDGYVAAGGLVASPRSLMELAFQLKALPPELKGAVIPRAPVSPDRSVGYGWFVDSLDDGVSMIWHNGGTGGFRTFVGSVPERDLAVVAAANAAVSVEELARAVVMDGTAPPSPPEPPLFNWIVGVLFLLFPIGYVLSRGAPPTLGITLPGTRPPEVVGSASAVAESAFLIGIWARTAPAPLYLPGSEYLLLTAVVAAAAGELYRAKRQSRLTFSKPDSSRLYTVARIVGALALGMVALFLW